MAIKGNLRDKFRGGQLQEKTKASYTKSKEGGGFQTYYNRKEGLQFWKMPMGDSIIDIIPYLSGNQDPLNPEGDPTYVLEIDIHEKIGAAEEKYVCLSQYGKDCPICEEQRRLREEGADWETVIKPLNPKKRCMYNIIVRDNGAEEKKGVQILEISYHFLEKQIAKLSKNPRTGGFISFSDPEEGRSIAFNKSGTKTKVDMSGFQLVERDVKISDADLEATTTLDELLKIEKYNLIYEKFHQRKVEEDTHEEEDEEPVPTPSKRKLEPEPEEGEAPPPRKRKPVVVEEELEPEEDEAPPPPKRRKPVEPEPEEEDEPVPPPKRRRPVEPEPEEEEDEVPPPPKRRKPVVVEEPEEDAAPPTKKKSTPSDGGGYKCPVKGGLFGVNVDEYDECDDCEFYTSCVDAS